MIKLKIGLVGIVAGLLMVSCGTVKRAETTKTEIKQVATTKVDSSLTKLTVTTFYGDTLSGTSFLPVFFDQADSTGMDSTIVESAGIKLKLKVTPRKNKAGVLVGNQIDFKAVAKPTSATSTQEVKQANVQTTTKTEAKVQSTSVATAKKGFGIASWVWWLIAFAALVAVGIYFKTPLNALKTWIKRF